MSTHLYEHNNHLHENHLSSFYAIADRAHHKSLNLLWGLKNIRLHEELKPYEATKFYIQFTKYVVLAVV
jgi:hypothetical protein